MQAPVMVLNANTQRETGRTAQLGNIGAAAAVADIVCSTLGASCAVAPRERAALRRACFEITPRPLPSQARARC